MCYSPLFRIKRNTSIFDREQGIKLAINVLQLISVEKNSKLELNFEDDVILFQYTNDHVKNVNSNKINCYAICSFKDKLIGVQWSLSYHINQLLNKIFLKI